MLCGLAAGWAGSAVASGPAYVFTDLGTGNGTASEALAINASGQVVGGILLAAGNIHAASFSAGQVTDLGTLAGGNQSMATAINSSGLITGWSENGTLDGTGSPADQAVLWSGGNLANLGLLAGDTDAQAFGINDSGNIVGESYTPNTDNQAVLYPAGSGPMSLGQLANATLANVTMSSALAINDAGQAAGWSATGILDADGNQTLHAVLYDAGGITDLGVLPGQVHSQATALNASESVVGYSYVSGNSPLAFAWTADGGMQGLGVLPNGSGSEATGINSSGQIVGWGDVGANEFDETVYDGFLYTNGTLYDLNDLAVNAAGWQIEFATGINDAGQITGSAINAAGYTHAFLLTPAGESAPGISAQPASVSVTSINGTANFTVAAVGEAPLSYQWQFNGVNIPNATGATLEVSDVNAADAGNYTVVVSNPLGNTTSAPARLNFLVFAIMDLGTLGGADSEALGLNASGQVVGVSITTPGANHAFVWSAGTMTDLGVLPGGSSSEAIGINNAGQITGSGDIGEADVFGNSIQHAFVYSDGAMLDINNSSVDQNSNSYSINDSGSVVGESFTDGLSGNTSNAFLYTPATGLNSLGPLPGGFFSQANSINDAGQSTGWSFTGNTDVDGYGIYHAVLYSAQDTIIDLGVLAGQESSIGLGINAEGVVVGFSYIASSPINVACVWPVSGPAQGLGVLPGGSTSEALEINDYNQIIGYSDVGTNGSGNPIYHPFIYSDGVMYDLSDLTVNASGWSSLFATAINDAGQICGYGVNSSGQTHAFLLTAVTQPNVVTPPGNQTVIAGASANFTVSSSGAPAPTLQWQVSTDGGKTWSNVSGGNFSGATSATLTISNTTLAMSGDEFRAVATNAGGSVSSQPAVLVVHANLPVITALTVLPADLMQIAGGNVTFSVTAVGSGNLTYQWQFKGRKISGATKSVYSIAKMAATNAGAYNVVVTNSLGNVTSANLTLTLGVLPKITTQPAKL
ncbi:MAG: immunoglobulin domain-containing protein, partial [Opitutales bacterium]